MLYFFCYKISFLAVWVIKTVTNKSLKSTDGVADRSTAVREVNSIFKRGVYSSEDKSLPPS